MRLPFVLIRRRRSAPPRASQQGCGSGPSPTGVGGDLRWRLPLGGSTAGRRDAADHQGLGGALQRWRGRRADRPQGRWPQALADRRAPPGLAVQIDRGPISAVDGVVRWRLCDLGQWLWEKFRVSVSVQTLSREMRAMGYRKLSARPKHHAQAEGAIEYFKKAFPRRWRASRPTRASASMP